MGVTQLGYVGVNTSNIEAWRDLMVNVFGLGERPRASSSDPLYLRLDNHHHRIALLPAKSDSLAYAGWEVATLDDLHTTAERLNSVGVRATPGSEAEADARKVLALYKFQDYDGNHHEIYYGPILDHEPPMFGRAISGFRADRLGLGHVVFACKDHYRSAAFFMKELGFRLSDYIAWDNADAIFMHCNPRHHSLALMNPAFGMKPGDLSHFMIETNSIDDVGRAYDIVRSRNVQLVLSLGRHTNDLMTSFYVQSPSGFAIEYGYGGQLIDDATWEIRKFSAPALWGHQPQVEHRTV
jgi:2,3-dihydroxybiphenyl 1,2-dioxygenase